jgi:(2R)-3-sulfolactate dehydrogenase (NADP+)
VTAARLSATDLETLIARAIAAAGANAVNAASVARALTLAEIDGHNGHGLSRVPSYAAHVRAGKVDGDATPTATVTRPGALLIDARHGFAYPSIDLAVARLPDMARAQGIAIAAITRSHHFGVAGHHVERLAAQDLVGLCCSNTPKAIAAWGGTAPVFGTNPIAFAAPRAGGSPVVVDAALSTVARGKILTAAQKGKPIPAGWALDANGRPTTDAQAALSGTLMPLGGVKGAALAFMVEALCTALTGARLATEASSLFDDTGGPPGLGHVLVAVDAGGLAGASAFAERFAALCAAATHEAGTRLPGDRRLSLRAAAERDGVAVDAALLAEVRRLAEGAPS